jgi:hypothetical protein
MLVTISLTHGIYEYNLSVAFSVEDYSPCGHSCLHRKEYFWVFNSAQGHEFLNKYLIITGIIKPTLGYIRMLIQGLLNKCIILV